MITYSNLSDVKKRIEDEFTHRNAECDKYDYLIAITCGAIAGIMDIFLVGNPKDSYLGKKVDKTVEKMTQKFAQLCGWDKQKALDKNKDLTKSAIAFLENKFKINYDQTTTNGRNGTNGKVDNLSMKNHHLKSIGHSPDIFGLFVSIVNQFTNTSTFVSNGKIITIDTNTFELQGGNFIAKIFCGFFNWFGHLASDWCGSSGGKERGAGIPMPFYNLFLLCDFGNFGQHRQTLAQIATQVFEQGYDLRHGVTMSIPNKGVELGRGVLFCYSLGSLFGPLILGFLMQYFEIKGFIWFYIVSLAFLILFAINKPNILNKKFKKKPGNMVIFDD